jgi:hypothetical protein
MESTPSSLPSGAAATPPIRCLNPASEINARLDTQVEVRVYPCNSQENGKKKFTTFNVKPEVKTFSFTNPIVFFLNLSQYASSTFIS